MKEIPSSVYRLQMGKNFSIKEASDLIPYLNDLGIEGIYSSPIFEAFSHGYDVTNPCRFNPVLGSMEDFEEFCSQLQKHAMKYLLDIVPNHMGIKGSKNSWWLDVLENGPSSAFAEFFDINWTPEKTTLQGKVLLPILDAQYGRVLEEGQLQLVWEEGFWIQYLDYLLPICYSSYLYILEKGSDQLPSGKDKEWIQCLSLAKSGKKEQFISFYKDTKFTQNRIGELLSLFNKTPDLLHELLEKQFYRLAYWVVAGHEINYRRFSNINELVAIHIEKEKVLNAHHRWIFDLLSSGKVQGLRVDHPDGLYDPGQYFERIRKKKPAFVWAEKILDFGESLPKQWDVDGTVGYDFLNILSGVFVQKKNEQRMTDIYDQFIEDGMDLLDVRYERRKRYLVLQMTSEINNLGALLDEISEKNRYFRDFTKADLTQAILEIFACFPIYRTYIKLGAEIRNKDRESILYAVEMAKKKVPEIDASIFNYIKSLLLLDYDYSSQDKDLAIDFLLRFQQLTAPVMAKGLEDSTFYIYNRLISLNEVGSNPHYFGFSKSEFHEFNKQKRTHWPLGALASSTHDTKYSEDARLRIHALSEIPQQWESLVSAWKKQNQKYKTQIEGAFFPEPNMEYFIYQMLIALWPADLDRLWTCLNKATREAGIHTSWPKVNEPYETAVKKFLEAILTPGEGNAFYPSFVPFQEEVARYGALNSLSALVLKIGSCGIVDLYQGNELMNFSLMDPDNRRPVDFASRKKELKQLKDPKMLLTAKALNFRRKNKELFLEGDYIPLKSPENVIAFMRKWKDQQAIVLAGRFFCEGLIEGLLELPKDVKPQPYQDLFTGKKFLPHKKGIELADVFEKYPCAILVQI